MTGDLVAVSEAHGQNAPGFDVPSRGYSENAWSKRASTACRDALTSRGYGAFPVSCDDVRSGGRCLGLKIATINRGDFRAAVEIHTDSRGEGGGPGPQVFYWRASPLGRAIAHQVDTRLAKLRGRSRPLVALPSEGYERDGFVRRTLCPAILVEAGAASNAEDLDWLMAETTADQVGWQVGLGIADALDEADREAMRDGLPSAL